MSGRGRGKRGGGGRKNAQQRDVPESLPVHVSSIQYAPYTPGSEDDWGDVSSGDESDFETNIRGNKGKKVKASNLNKADFSNNFKVLFPFSPGDTELSDTEVSSVDSSRMKPSSTTALETTFQDLGGNSPEQISVLKNRQKSLVKRRNWSAPTKQVFDDKSERRVEQKKHWSRSWQDDKEESVPRETIERRAKKLRRRAYKVGDSELAKTVTNNLLQHEKKGAEVPYSQLRQHNLESERETITTPSLFVTMDDDNRQRAGHQPVEEALDIFSKNKKIRRVPVAYTYHDPKMTRSEQRMAFDVSVMDGQSRRLQSELGGNPYAPEPLQFVKLNDESDKRRVSFLGVGKKRNERTRESRHLEDSLSIKPKETQWTKQSYLTEPQPKFTQGLRRVAKDKKPDKFRRLLRGHPQSHSNTPELARAALDNAGIKKERRAWTSVASTRLNTMMTFSDEEPKVGEKRSRSVAFADDISRGKDEHSKKVQAMPGYKPLAVKVDKNLNLIASSMAKTAETLPKEFDKIEPPAKRQRTETPPMLSVKTPTQSSSSRRNSKSSSGRKKMF